MGPDRAGILPSRCIMPDVNDLPVLQTLGSGLQVVKGPQGLSTMKV